jgi:hypothetical protein
MFIRWSRVSLIAAVAGLGLLVACDDSAKTPDATAPAASTKSKKPKAEGLPADMVAAVSASRSVAAIGMHFALGTRPEVNKALPVEIAIVPHQDFDSVSAHFESQDGLAVSVGEDYGPLSSPAAERALRHQLVLLPGREGLFMVTASIETIDPAGNVTRVFSIPVVVSPPGGEPAPAEPTTAQPQSPTPPSTN